MRSLALDATSGDLALASGRLTLVEGAAAIAQRLDGRLSLWAGDWFADTSVGVPFLSFLGVKGAAPLAEAALRRAVASCPGVASIEAFTFAASADRRAVVDFRVRTVTGEIIDRGGYQVGV